jgi:hypothetical protein
MPDPAVLAVETQLFHVAFAGLSLPEVLQQLVAITAVGLDGCDAAGLIVAD